MTVGAANWDGAHSATEHLLQLGHRRIGMIGGREDLQCSSAREDGYLSALRRAGVAVDPALMVPGDFSIESGEAGTLKLGLSIREDLSIIGFDDIPAAEWIEPGLTTIRQPVVQMAEAAMRALLRHLDGDEELPQRIELGTELVVRASTAAPRKA
jgi:LacI family transcriptional regulator